MSYMRVKLLETQGKSLEGNVLFLPIENLVGKNFENISEGEEISVKLQKNSRVPIKCRLLSIERFTKEDKVLMREKNDSKRKPDERLSVVYLKPGAPNTRNQNEKKETAEMGSTTASQTINNMVTQATQTNTPIRVRRNSESQTDLKNVEICDLQAKLSSYWKMWSYWIPHDIAKHNVTSLILNQPISSGSPSSSGSQSIEPIDNKPAPTNSACAANVDFIYLNQIRRLNEMGFTNHNLNLRVLRTHNGNLEEAMEYLLKNEN